MAGRLLACEAQSIATWVLDLLNSLKVDKESFSTILKEIKSDTFSLFDKFSAFMVIASFWRTDTNCQSQHSSASLLRS